MQNFVSHRENETKNYLVNIRKKSSVEFVKNMGKSLDKSAFRI